MKWEVDRKNTYILRYYLPCDPTYDEKTFYARGRDLIQYCLDHKISAAMLYVDLSPHWYYMPDTVEHTRYYAKLLGPVIRDLRANGISYQLNYQNLFGSWDGGADLDYVNQWENWVDEKGLESKGCACSLGKRFRQIAGEKLAIWAATKPDVIWIDDDIRFSNHRTAIRGVWAGEKSVERRDFGCFCHRHIDLFNQRNGLHCSREEIEDGILKGNALRKQWLTFSGSMASETAAWIEETIHQVSPETIVAVMTSSPDQHSTEGRDWDTFLTNLSGADKPLLRPTFGPYAEGNPRGFFDSYIAVEHLKANIRSQYGADVIFCPEIENTRFTRWSKSVAATQYQLLLSAFMGCRGITLSIFDLEGCLLAEEPELGEMLDEMRPVRERLAEYDLWNWESEGIGLFTGPDRVAGCSRVVSEMDQLSRGRKWDEKLLEMGIPCRYVTPEDLDHCNGLALDAYSAELLLDEEIVKVLSGNVLLDAGALEVLERRGYGIYLGVKPGDKVPCIAACEVLDTCVRSDGSRVRIPSRIEGNRWNDLVLEGAEKISTLLTPYGSEHVGFARYRNSLGGLIYVYAANGGFGDGFFTNYRVKLMKQICMELSDHRLPELQNGSYALTAVKVSEGRLAVLVVNMSADVLKAPVWTIPTEIAEDIQSGKRSMRLLSQNGQEIQPQISGNTICAEGMELKLYQGMVFLVV